MKIKHESVLGIHVPGGVVTLSCGDELTLTIRYCPDTAMKPAPVEAKAVLRRCGATALRDALNRYLEETK